MGQQTHKSCKTAIVNNRNSWQQSQWAVTCFHQNFY